MAEYIEREALLMELMRKGCTADVIEKIMSVSAADVVPVVHGRWIHCPDCGVTRCSHCGWSIEECWESKRCPECGAKMDGGADHAAD